jgi:5S rRNA maturation endonuclease (ribonuclease M5)
VKTVSVLGNQKTATRMVVFEGGLDALALAELEAREDTIYVSTGGGFGPRTEAALLKSAEGREVLSGFDNDAAGEILHRQLTGLLPGATRLAPPPHVEGTKKPCKDWLDVLNASKGASSPPMPPARPRSAGKVENEVPQPVRAPHLDETEMPNPG